jgi:allophanate hydrolase subunit 1
MNHEYRPSYDFVKKVMDQVYAYEASQASLAEWIMNHSFIRYAVVGSGMLLGVLKAASAF